MCDQHRESWGDPLVLSYRATNTENWRAFVILPTQSTGVFSLRLSYCETNKDNWRAFLGFLTYTILRPTQKTGMPFYISSIVRTTQNTDFFIRVYIIVRSTQKTGGPFYWAACAPSHKMGFRSSAAKNGLPGEERHEGLVPRNDVLTNGFI